MIRSLRLIAVLLCCATFALAGAGCATPSRTAFQPVSNPLSVTAVNEDQLWERTIDVLHDYHFRIERENRIARVIETAPRVGSGVLEPWNNDSVGLDSRMESTLQSIRRTVIVTMIPAETPGGFHIAVQVLKEKEDVAGLTANSPGAATFLESAPLTRDLDPVLGQSGPSTWIPLGRDMALEQSLLRSLQSAYFRTR